MWGFEPLISIILIIVCVLPVFLGIGAGMQGNWGAMFLLIAIGGGLILLLQASGI